jgi:cell division protease FtsH
MAKMKLWNYLRANWLKFLLIFLCAAFVFITLTLLTVGFTNFAQLESFSRKQMTAQMGIYLFMGIIQAVIFVALYAVLYYVMMGGGIAKFLGSDTSIHAKANVKWDEVIGMEQAKKEAWEIVQFLKDRKLLKVIGGNIIKGTLLVGSPGCGKTYLAKAIATEAGLPFLSAVGSEFVGMFMGIGAARVKALFKDARKMAKIEGGCIIFIDEIDSFARPRTADLGGGAVTDHSATVNQFLAELDGLRQTENNVVVIAATNVPEEELDPAIMRSGRFDRKIEITKPTSRDREALLRFYLQKISSDPAIEVSAIADKMKWFSPADINNAVREAAIIAMRERRQDANQVDLEQAVERVIRSIEKTSGSAGSIAGSVGNKLLSSNVNVKWEDIIGMESAKREAREIVELLRDRHRVTAIGGKIVKGVLLMGPPGCGKTYIAKAMATEAGFPMISMTGSEFFAGIWHGTGPKRVMQLFKEARMLARAEGGCIIFIDEMDSFAHPRSLETGGGAISEENNTINQFLAEMDGLRLNENNIILLGATNATEEMLDPAILRAGRFERKIYVTRPNLTERKLLFDFYLKRVKTADDVNSEILARKTLWFSPADIDNMVREGGMLALRDKREVINFRDLSQAYDRILYGEKSNTLLSDKEKEWVSYHESGHAIIAYLLHPTNDVIKATIIPHKGSLGFVAPRPKEEINIRSKEWYLAEIKVSVASYAAEKIKFGTTGSGVSADFQNALSIARQMVWNWGMGQSGYLGDLSAGTTRYSPAPLSEKTKEKLDEDVQHILSTCLNDVAKVLEEHRPLLDTFALELFNKGELEYDEIQAIFDRFGLKPQTRPLA